MGSNEWPGQHLLEAVPTKDQSKGLSDHFAKCGKPMYSCHPCFSTGTCINRATGHKFQQDGASVHTARTTAQWLAQHNIKRFNGGKWPAQSPDLHPIEHLWPIVGRKLIGRVFHNRNELWEALVAAFGSVTPTQVQRLYTSLPNRMRAVLEARGRHTRY